MEFPKHKAGLALEHNVYKGYHDPVERGVADEDEHWINDEEREKALATGEIWTLQWYPDTPVGFHRLAAASLESLLEHANAE